MHYLCSLKIPKTIIKSIDQARRHCLWAKAEGAGTPHSLAAWNLVCRPKKKGGLGVINLELQNKALLIKHLHKFFCHHDTPWVKLVWSIYEPGPPQAQSPRGSFWWRDIFSLVSKFREVAVISPGSGRTVLFWHDNWTFNGTPNGPLIGVCRTHFRRPVKVLSRCGYEPANLFTSDSIPFSFFTS